jgi:glycerol-3-phosphate acyltransferase PlsY
MIGIIAATLIGYLLGSIPFGLILTRLGGHGDVRQIGSGNIGATNVLRTGSKSLSAATLVLDIGKGTVAALIGSEWGAEPMLAASAAVIIGHMFPVWLGFRGGKGVATVLGVLIAIAWHVALAAAAVWLAVAIASRYSSAAALAATLTAAAYADLTLDRGRAMLITGIVVLVIVRHHENIRRLVAGTESRISLTKPRSGVIDKRDNAIPGIGDNRGPPLDDGR